MASLTAKEIVDKVSELRSKIAVYDMLLLHLNSNYLSTEGKNEDDVVPPEMFVTRDDGARVGERHLHGMISDLRNVVVDLRAELEDWESLPMELPSKTKKDKKADEHKPKDQPADRS